jgi:glycosyltransferase involved in cell wall biosynthesis
MSYPLFSVLMANYNRGKFIEESIQSVLSQTYPNLELVIVDDGSSDDSAVIARRYAGVDTRIRFFQNDSNMGCGGAMRKCADFASGEYMGYLGSDDTLTPEAVETMVQAHIRFPDCSLIYSSHYVCDEALNIQRMAYGAEKIPAHESYLTHGKGVTSFASFSKAHYLQTEGVNAGFKRAVDQDLYYKLEEAGKLFFVDKPLYKYRVNSSGISTHRNISKARYWFVRAKENAYQRRLLNPSAKNIDKKELNAWWSVLYITKSSAAFQQIRICKGIYWFVCSLNKSIFDRYTRLKFQSFFLNSFPHRVFKRLRLAWKKPS